MNPAQSAADTVTLSLPEATRLAYDALTGAGMAPHHAAPVAAQFAAAEADGIPSHGLARVPSACAMLRIGKIAPAAEPQISRPRPGLLHVDAGDGFPHLGIEMATPQLTAITREQGIAALLVTRAYACGVLGYHTERLAASGLVVLGFTQAPASIAPTGGRRAVIGTNPISLAVPAPGGAALLIDQSSSVVAKSEVMQHHARNQPIPSHWAFDKGGLPTTSASDALNGGTMAPSGGYKGFGIGLIVEIFAALLTGANLGLEAPGLADPSSGPPGVGACFIAIDADPSIAGNAFGSRLETLLAAISEQDGARIPGARRHEWRQRTATSGITIPSPLYDTLRRS